MLTVHAKEAIKMLGAAADGLSLACNTDDSIKATTDLLVPVHQVLVMLKALSAYGVPLTISDPYIESEYQNVLKHIEGVCQT